MSAPRRFLRKTDPRRYAPPPDDDPDRRALLDVLELRGLPVVRGRCPVRECRAEAACAHRQLSPPPAFVRAASAYLERHTGFCVNTVLKVSARHVPDDDVMQVCRLGCMTALERFDPSLAGKFLSYATHWVGLYVRQMLTDEAQFNVPPEVRQARRQLARLGPDDLTDEEAATTLGLAVEDVRDARQAYLGNDHRQVDERLRGCRRGLEDVRRARAERAATLAQSEVALEALRQLSPESQQILWEEFGVGDRQEGVRTPQTDSGRKAWKNLALRRLREAMEAQESE